MKYFNKIVSVILLIPTIYLTFIFGVVNLTEGYNVFNPYIDTRFSEKYNPEIFNQIKIGMTKENVISLIGNPLSKYETLNEIEYHYTSDGKFHSSKKVENYLISDFAWYSSNVIFDTNNRVIKIEKQWFFD